MQNQNNLKKTPDKSSVFSFKKNDNVSKKDIEKNIIANLQLLLNKTFNDPIKKQLEFKINRLNFSCPYCHDSVKTPWKKRGNLYLDTYFYHCYNCGKHVNYEQFAKDFSFDVDNSELTEIKKIIQDSIQKSGSHVFVGSEIFFDKELIDKYGIDRDYLIKTLNYTEIKNSSIENYLKHRLQFNFNNFAWDAKNNRLVIFNLSADNKKVIGFQFRNFSKNNVKFLTYNLQNIYKYLNKNIPETENFEYLNKLSTFFGILKLNINKPVTVFEGPMDSFLFPNAIATCSVNIDIPIDISIQWFYDYDDIGRKKSIEKLNNNEIVFLWKKFIKENELDFNTNKKLDLNKLLIYIKKHKLKIKPFVNYFSNNKYNLIWI